MLSHILFCCEDIDFEKTSLMLVKTNEVITKSGKGI